MSVIEMGIKEANLIMVNPSIFYLFVGSILLQFIS